MEVLEVRELPWGREEIIARGSAVAVKIITIRSGQRSSLQRHKKRSEFWTVLSDAGGTIRIGEEHSPAKHGVMFKVPQGAIHRYTAPEEGELKLLEIWQGECDQNDIERLEDDYGRV